MAGGPVVPSTVGLGWTVAAPAVPSTVGLGWTVAAPDALSAVGLGWTVAALGTPPASGGEACPQPAAPSVKANTRMMTVIIVFCLIISLVHCLVQGVGPPSGVMSL